MKYKAVLVILVMVLASVACSFGTTTQATATPASNPSGENPSSSGGSSSGLVDKVVLAKDTQGDAKDPVNPTDTFGTSDVIHAVVATNNAPADTSYTAKWYVVDVGSAAKPGDLIDTYTVTTEGSRNVDFTLEPSSTWPTGTYKVEIYVNDQLDQTIQFSVK